MNLIFQVISLQGILGLSSLQSTHAMLPFWLKDGILKDSIIIQKVKRESLCLCVPLYSDRCEEADAYEVSRHRCERPEEILSQIGLLQREMLVRLQTGGDLS